MVKVRKRKAVPAIVIAMINKKDQTFIAFVHPFQFLYSGEVTFQRQVFSSYICIKSANFSLANAILSSL